jgi:hypothetical protein
MLPAAQPSAPFRASYIDYFADASNDPFQEQYAAAMAPYDVPLQNNPGSLAPEQIRALIIGACAQCIPTAFLLMHDDLLQVYLQAQKFYPHLVSLNKCLMTSNRSSQHGSHRCQWDL